MVNVGEGHVVMYAHELHSSGGDSTNLLELGTTPYLFPALFYLYSIYTGRNYLRFHILLGMSLVFNWFMMFLVSLDASLVYSAFNGDYMLLGMFLNSLLILFVLIKSLSQGNWKNRVSKTESF